LLVPTYPLAAIITARPESLRDLTEQWLKRHNVKYKSFMRPDKVERTFENVVKIKSEVTNSVKPFWFWESDYKKAKAIHELTKRPVLCV
jgi:hypothetical protein